MITRSPDTQPPPGIREKVQEVVRAVLRQELRQLLEQVNKPDPMLTKQDWQRILGVSPRTVDRLIAGGGLPAGRIIGGKRLWTVVQVERFLALKK